MSEMDVEMKKTKLRKLNEDLTRINIEMKNFYAKTKNYQTVIMEGITIDNNIYQQDLYSNLEKEIKSVINIFENDILPNVQREARKQ